MKTYLLLIPFIFIGCSNSGRNSSRSGYVPNINESAFGYAVSLFSDNYFTINSSKITFANDYGCVSLLCSDEKDCVNNNALPKSFLICRNDNRKIGFSLMVTNYSSFSEKYDIESALYDALPPAWDVRIKSPRPSFTYKLADNYYSSDQENIKIATNYIIRNSKSYHMSDWLKSLNCKSMNFISLLNDLKMAKTIISGSYQRINNKLYLKVLDEDIQVAPIEIDESSGEMKYVANEWLDKKFKLYSLQPINLKTQKIKAINFCESLHQF